MILEPILPKPLQILFKIFPRYRQACLYDFKNHEKMPDRVGGVKNFERMVWKSAKEFGIGRARSHNLPCTYIIGWYNPILGTAEENVVQGEFRGRECLKVSKNPEKYLHDSDRSRRKIFLCGESAAVLREKACAHFGCKSGMFVRQKIWKNQRNRHICQTRWPLWCFVVKHSH